MKWRDVNMRNRVFVCYYSLVSMIQRSYFRRSKLNGGDTKRNLSPRNACNPKTFSVTNRFTLSHVRVVKAQRNPSHSVLLHVGYSIELLKYGKNIYTTIHWFLCTLLNESCVWYNIPRKRIFPYYVYYIIGTYRLQVFSLLQNTKIIMSTLSSL